MNLVCRLLARRMTLVSKLPTLAFRPDGLSTPTSPPPRIPNDLKAGRSVGASHAAPLGGILPSLDQGPVVRRPHSRSRAFCARGAEGSGGWAGSPRTSARVRSCSAAAQRLGIEGSLGSIHAVRLRSALPGDTTCEQEALLTTNGSFFAIRTPF